MLNKPDGRYTSPPTEEKLRDSTGRLTASLDVLAARVGSEPLPAAVAVAALDLTDEQRLACYRELDQRWYDSGLTHLDQVMATCQREARARLVGRST